MNTFIFTEVLGLAAAFVLSLLGTRAYKSFATRKGILANPNFRTLHERPVPKGGGFVFSLIFVLGVLILWLLKIADSGVILALGLGGGMATLFGFLDDIMEFNVPPKLLIQIFLAAWTVFCFDGGPLTHIGWIPGWFAWMLTCFLLVWMINLYNFMDGIDGMAGSGAVFIAGVAAIVVFINGHSNMALVLVLLSVSCLGFLLFNWPPASIFMGDSGSIFLGYCFGALIVKTVMDGEISFWTWLVILGYFLGDTTTTLLLRIIIVKKYKPHRSHAYQNLARIWGSHLKVTSLVVAYHCVWLLPLAIWSALQQETAPLAAILALVPVVLWTLRYGPILSSS
jgi:Fuc2NAc and GlcNAc transferase